MMYFLRLIMLQAVSSVAIYLSSLTHRMDAAYLIVCGILVLPGALWIYMGIEFFQWLSPLYAIDGIGRLVSDGGNIQVILVWMIAWLMIGVGGIIGNSRRWV